jgi:hypothetical protein
MSRSSFIRKLAYFDGDKYLLEAFAESDAAVVSAASEHDINKDELLKRVKQVQKNFNLDEDAYTPSTVKAIAAIMKKEKEAREKAEGKKSDAEKTPEAVGEDYIDTAIDGDSYLSKKETKEKNTIKEKIKARLEIINKTRKDRDENKPYLKKHVNFVTNMVSGELSGKIKPKQAPAAAPAPAITPAPTEAPATPFPVTYQQPSLLPIPQLRYPVPGINGSAPQVQPPNFQPRFSDLFQYSRFPWISSK